MKRILAIAILLVSFCISAVSVRAESNPLLTVFENIKTGQDGTKLSEVIDSLPSGERYSSSFGLLSDGNIVVQWNWDDQEGRVTLEVIVGPYEKNVYELLNKPALHASYHFPRLKKYLSK